MSFTSNRALYLDSTLDQETMCCLLIFSIHYITSEKYAISRSPSHGIRAYNSICVREAIHLASLSSLETPDIQ